MYVFLYYLVFGLNKYDLNFLINMFKFVFYLILDVWGLMGLFKLVLFGEICYKKYGCFSIEKLFINIKGILFEKFLFMGVWFLLYIWKNFRKVKKFKRCGKREDFLDEKFLKFIKMIIYGYVDKGCKDWVRRMIREIIKNVSLWKIFCI